MNIHKLLITDENKKIMVKKINKDFNIKKLLDRYDLDQSQSIRFGSVFENFIKNVATFNNSHLNENNIFDIYETGNKTNKGKKDVDIYFEYNNIYYYFECKTNLNLDSEKSKETDKKVEDVLSFLNNTNKTKGGILSCWYEKEKDLKVKVKNVFYMKDFFDIFDMKVTKDEYYLLMKEFGKSI